MRLTKLFMALGILLPIVSCHAQHATAGLMASWGNEGLTSVTYNGQSLLAWKWSGKFGVTNRTPKSRQADGTSVELSAGTPQTQWDAGGQKITSIYPWGEIACAYSQQADRLIFQITGKNATGSYLTALDVQIAELKFAAIPNGNTFEAGMWGNGGVPGPVHRFPLIANPKFSAPLINVQFQGGTLVFGSEDPGDGVGLQIPFTTDPGTKTVYPFRVSLGELAPGQSRTAKIYVQFGLEGSDPAQLGKDTLEAYRKFYPATLKWSDHRPIGALFLATGQAHPETNPRGWFLNDKSVDVTTPEGLQKWRDRVLKYADDSIKVLQDMNAQGMVTWDPEGEQYSQTTYYGDPRLTERLAPETAFTGDGKTATIDAYFQKFRDAGLRTGVCLRPQQIQFIDGIPRQIDVETAEEELIEKVAYANKRWGCTLFYVDSTVDKVGSLNPDIFRDVAAKYPNVLLMPENESGRYYAYTAPLNSFAHHNVTSTPAVARAVYPNAFSVLLASTSKDKYDANRAALVAAVKRGDILLVNAWYPGEQVAATKEIYAEAAK